MITFLIKYSRRIAEILCFVSFEVLLSSKYLQQNFQSTLKYYNENCTQCTKFQFICHPLLTCMISLNVCFFLQGRVQHIRQILKEKYPNEPEKTTISSDEMSVFYKEFLDQRWTTHIQYNLEWQKRNFNMIGLAFLVTLEGLVKPNQ